MIRKFILLAILALPAISFAQGSCYPAGVVLLDTGRPANGASVRVCQAGSTGTPCTPAASLFTDPTLGTPLSGSPTVTTDAHGNFGFCAAAGLNYDLQVSGSGITTLTVKNLPLPPTSPVVAGSLTSSSANPANVGQIKLASTDCIDWRNNANSGNIQLCKNTSDQFTFSGALVNQSSVNSSLTAPTIGGSGATFSGSTSGSTILKASATASGTITLPAATGTLAVGSLNLIKFTSSGTHTIVCSSELATLVGGGGGGGGATSANNGGGGASGGYAVKNLSGLTIGSTITVTVGAAGAGSAGANGSAGTASSIASGTQTITTVTANGGGGGSTQAGAIATPGTAAAVSTNGDINGAGTPGNWGVVSLIGGNGSATFLGGAGVGGANVVGGSAIVNTGSGGGGAGGPSSSLSGGNGAAGIVMFECTN
jgi:hypothetical protein